MRPLVFLLGVICLFVICESRDLAGQTPQLFGSGTISTPDDEFGGTLSPDGKSFYFGKKAPATGRSSFLVICYSALIDGQWSAPLVAPFSGQYRDLNPHFSADGTRIFFVSNRPKDSTPKLDSDIWVTDKTKDGWSEPTNLENINSSALEQSCSVTNDGTIYFVSGRDGKSLNIFRSAFVHGSYQQPEMLDSAVNSAGNEADVCIAPDESYLLFVSADRGDILLPQRGAQYPRADLYISYRKNGHWSPAHRLDQPINSLADESSPYISKDGKTLFFASERSFVSIPMKMKLTYDELDKQLHGITNGFGNIWMVSTDALQEQ